MQSTHSPAPFDPNYALFLDVDGTLADFRDDPADVWLSESLLLTLTLLCKVLHGALALISGRTVADLDRMIGDRPLFCIGLHGLSRNAHCPALPGAPRVSVEIDALRRACHDFALDYPGVMVENKQLGLALHYRRNPQFEAVVRNFARDYQQRNTRSGFELLEGKMVMEFRPTGINKGVAVEHLLAQPPFNARVPVFIGDDVTDEAGFAAVNRVGGISIKCGQGDTCASYRLPDVGAVQYWLEQYVTYLTEA